MLLKSRFNIQLDRQYIFDLYLSNILCCNPDIMTAWLRSTKCILGYTQSTHYCRVSSPTCNLCNWFTIHKLYRILNKVHMYFLKHNIHSHMMNTLNPYNQGNCYLRTRHNSWNLHRNQKSNLSIH